MTEYTFAANAMPAADFDRHLADIMRRQATVTENSQSTAGKCKGISISNSKAAILAQYAQEDSEGEDEYPYLNTNNHFNISYAGRA